MALLFSSGLDPLISLLLVLPSFTLSVMLGFLLKAVAMLCVSVVLCTPLPVSVVFCTPFPLIVLCTATPFSLDLLRAVKRGLTLGSVSKRCPVVCERFTELESGDTSSSSTNCRIC